MKDSTLRLKQLAEAATPIWKYPSQWQGPYGIDAEDVDGTFVLLTMNSNMSKFKSDALFISAANPEAVLGLISRIEKLEAALKFYGNPVSHYMRHDSGDGFVNTTDVDLDAGRLAREALKEET